MQHFTLLGNPMEKIEKQVKQNSTTTQNNPMVVSISFNRSNEVRDSTGFFVRDNLIATNIHCIAGATSLSVKPLDSNTEYGVEGVVAFDTKNDLVILKTSRKGIPFSIDDSNLIEKGEFVKAVGYIDEKYMTTAGNYQSTLNEGRWLRTTAKTDNGYSGGPLLNSKGKVIGINFLGGDYYSDAISSNHLKKLLSQRRSIESLDQWQKRKKIRAYDYLVQSIRKENDDAIAALDKAIQLDKNSVFAYYKRGEIKHCIAKSKLANGNLLEAQQHLKSAIDDFTKGIKTLPDLTINYNNRSDAKLHLGNIEASMGNIHKAQDLFKDALIDINLSIKKDIDIPIEKDPDVAAYYHTRGEIKEAMGDLNGAIEDFKEARKNNEYTEDSEVSVDLERVKHALENTQ